MLLPGIYYDMNLNIRKLTLPGNVNLYRPKLSSGMPAYIWMQAIKCR